MAKPRKQKNEDQKAETSEALVRHQKLCLSIDVDRRLIYGYTELEVAVPDSGVIGLHADNLGIESVSVDGLPAQYEHFPHYKNVESDERWSTVSSASSAADVASSIYISSLEREMVPNLLIMCSKDVEVLGNEQQAEQRLDNGSQPSTESKQVHVGCRM